MLCAAGYNIRWLLRMIVKKGLGLLLCLFPSSGIGADLSQLSGNPRAHASQTVKSTMLTVNDHAHTPLKPACL